MTHRLRPFKLERYFDRYEFSAPFLLSPSDCESLALPELLSMADRPTRALWDNLSLGYTEAPGHPLLRSAIAALYTQTGPNQVLVLTPEEGIFIAMHSLLSPGDEVICISPAYQSLHEIARSLGCTVRPWNLVPSPQGWTLDLDQLAQSINNRTRLVVINFPHNPTGYLLPISAFEKVIALARDHNLFIFSDEMYRLLEYDDRLRLPAICDCYERGITLSGVSKNLALPGLRIGWLATPDNNLREQWISIKDYTTICSSAPSEILALIGISARSSILARNREIILNNLVLAETFFSRYAHLFNWLPPQAGSVSFPKWIGPGSIEALCTDLVERFGVMLAPGTLFNFPGNHFRLGLGRRNFQAALERFERYLKSIQ